MTYCLAQLNIAKFRKPEKHPDNVDFVSSIDAVNAVADSEAGFVWRYTEDDDELIERWFKAPNTLVNLSLWADIDALRSFVYRNADHIAIMRRRKEWFDKIDVHLVLWWVREGHIPTIEEASERLRMLKDNGPTPHAFNFRSEFPPPSSEAKT